MVMPYRETPEDRTLASAFRLYNGQRIDIRWAGGWLTPEGRCHPVDYKNGVTHETIADEYGGQIVGSGSIMTRPPIMRLFDVANWIRITYLETSTFCVEFKGALFHSELGKRSRMRTVLRFVQDFKHFDTFFVYALQTDGNRIRQGELKK